MAVKRVRAVLLTENNNLMLIKRVKPNGTPPYWVAPGGGEEPHDHDLLDTLRRELCEELGATAEVLYEAFVLEHEKDGKNLVEYFYVCRLIEYDLSQRHGPEFSDPSHGLYLVDEIPLIPEALERIDIKTPELLDWLLDNLDELRALNDDYPVEICA